MSERNDRLRVGLISCALGILTLAIFWPVLGHDFINLDDPVYVTANARVKAGLTWDNVKWVFTHVHASFWHPLSTLSHMVDCQLYGLKPAGHHATNLLLHTANVVLLFLVLTRMSSALWCSALVAALFAWHPLHVESVAWIAERKDVLSTLFWLLTMWAYVGYVKKRAQNGGPGGADSIAWNDWSYLLSLIFFTLGLMSKPMLVTLPFVMLLIDYWPLRRMTNDQGEWTVNAIRNCVVEKIPFFGLAAIFMGIAIFAQQHDYSLISSAQLPYSTRLENAVLSYLAYIEKTFWPAGLSVFYPYPETISAIRVVIDLLVLIVFTVFVVRMRRLPFLAVGWFWYLGTLVPVIGLVQVGAHAMADRYTYIPLIGLFIMVVWAGAEVFKNVPQLKLMTGLVSAVVLVACAMATFRQLSFWQNTQTLFLHADSVTPRNYLAKTVLGVENAKRGKFDEAMRLYSQVLQIKPNYSEAYFAMGAVQQTLGKTNEAISSYRQAIRLDATYPEARKFYGLALVNQKQWAQAEEQLGIAAALMPDDPQTLFNLGLALHNEGKLDAAIVRYEESISLDPSSADAHLNLGNALIARGDFRKAVTQFREVLRLKPDSVDALNRLSWILATNADGSLRDGAEAVRLAGRACELTKNGEPFSLLSLAVARAETGGFDQARAAAEKAEASAKRAGLPGVAQISHQLVELFRQGKPYREGR